MVSAFKEHIVSSSKKGSHQMGKTKFLLPSNTMLYQQLNLYTPSLSLLLSFTFQLECTCFLEI